MNIKVNSIILVALVGYCQVSYSMMEQTNEFNENETSTLSHLPLILPNKHFNFNRIAFDDCFTNTVMNNTISNNGVSIELSNGKIVSFNDGKKTPLFLGNIPQQQSHIHILVATALLIANTNQVEIFSLNIKAERDALGLSKLLVNNQNLALFKYPTVDLAAPSLIDLIRAIRDLENRDSRQKGLVLVHCKAGAGRSPLVIAAYLIHIAHKARINVEPDQILDYLLSRRAQVNLNVQQKDAIRAFQGALLAAGSFENLISNNKNLVERRDKEVFSL